MVTATLDGAPAGRYTRGVTRSALRPTLRCLKYVVSGALAGATLGVLMLLPGEMLADPPSDVHAPSPLFLTIGVGLVTARAGAVVGLIFFLIRRSLMGEVDDPRQAPS